MSWSSLPLDVQEYLLIIAPLAIIREFRRVNKYWSQYFRQENFWLRKLHYLLPREENMIRQFWTQLQEFLILERYSHILYYYQLIPMSGYPEELIFCLRHHQPIPPQHFLHDSNLPSVGYRFFTDDEIYAALELQHPECWRMLNTQLSLFPILYAQHKYGHKTVAENLQLRFGEYILADYPLLLPEISTELASLNRKYTQQVLKLIKMPLNEIKNCPDHRAAQELEEWHALIPKQGNEQLAEYLRESRFSRQHRPRLPDRQALEIIMIIGAIRQDLNVLKFAPSSWFSNEINLIVKMFYYLPYGTPFYERLLHFFLQNSDLLPEILQQKLPFRTFRDLLLLLPANRRGEILSYTSKAMIAFCQDLLMPGEVVELLKQRTRGTSARTIVPAIYPLSNNYAANEDEPEIFSA